MKINLFYLSGLMLFIAGCSRSHLNLIPEIHSPLIQEEVYTLTEQALGNMLFPCAEGIGWVDKSGKIVTWNVEKKIAGTVIQLPFKVIEPPFRQENFIVFSNQNAEQLLVFDLARMETRFILRDLPVKKVLAVAGDCLIYLDGENLVVYNWQNPAGIFRCPTAEKKFFNCHFFPDQILIPGSRQLFKFSKSSGKFQVLSLPAEAITEFYYQGKSIYYGSGQRQLVKYSLLQNKLIWKFQLGQNLEQQPFNFSGTIVINPADNNVIQLNDNGSVLWWLALDSIPQFNPVPMTDHLAVFLINHKIKFINFRSRQITDFKINGRPAGRPLAYKHDLYFILAAAGKTQKLQRVGNRYGIEVTSAPEKMQPAWMPITLSVLTNNLLKPKLSVVITNEVGQSVLAKDFEMADRATMVWIPTQAGIYRIQVKAFAKNRNEEKEISFQVFDPLKIISGFYLNFLYGWSKDEK